MKEFTKLFIYALYVAVTVLGLNCVKIRICPEFKHTEIKKFLDGDVWIETSNK